MTVCSRKFKCGYCSFVRNIRTAEGPDSMMIFTIWAVHLDGSFEPTVKDYARILQVAIDDRYRP